MNNPESFCERFPPPVTLSEDESSERVTLQKEVTQRKRKLYKEDIVEENRKAKVFFLFFKI